MTTVQKKSERGVANWCSRTLFAYEAFNDELPPISDSKQATASHNPALILVNGMRIYAFSEYYGSFKK